MPCFLLLIVLLFPRVALVLMWFYSTYLQRAFHGGLVLPALGFIFLPVTTIVYAWELNSGMPTVEMVMFMCASTHYVLLSSSTAQPRGRQRLPTVGRAGQLVAIWTTGIDFVLPIRRAASTFGARPARRRSAFSRPTRLVRSTTPWPTVTVAHFTGLGEPPQQYGLFGGGSRRRPGFSAA